MKAENSADYVRQQRLIHALCKVMRQNARAGHVLLLETHISWILLVGREAYKIKKSVNLGFADFSTLLKRQFFCKEEIRLNKRLAPDLYLDVVAIGGSEQRPQLGQMPILEYAVRMQRFPLNRQFDRLLARQQLLPQYIDALATKVADFHQSLAGQSKDNNAGSALAVQGEMRENFSTLNSLLSSANDRQCLAELQQASEHEFSRCAERVEQRKAAGFVRECHGDLHLGNIVLINNEPVPFDAIEFNPALRNIDVISEVAFTMMDLMHSGRADWAWRFLNKYLEHTGDYAAAGVLPHYLAYRAMVRAKVSAIRGAQLSDTAQRASALQQCREYMQLARFCLGLRHPCLIITHGLPGSGKSTFAAEALERLHAIRIRSDVERKRMFGVPALAHSREQTGRDLYGGDISALTYDRLYELARDLLHAGMCVIVDAAFLQRTQRQRFAALARELAVPFALASITAPDAELRARILARQKTAADPSEADIAVLEKLQHAQDRLAGDELDDAVVFDNSATGSGHCAAGWQALQLRLRR